MDGGPRFLHVIPRVVRRGPEVFAAHLAEVLTAEHGTRNLLFPLFGPAEGPPAARVGAVPGARPPGRTAAVLGADPGAVARTRHGLRRLRPDLAVAHGWEALKHVVLADPRARIPLAWRDVRAGGAPGRRSAVRFLSRPAVVLTPSEAARDDLVGRLGVPEDRVWVVPPARRTPPSLDRAERESVRAGLGAKPDVPLIAWIGRLSEERRPGVALQVFALVRSRFGECTLALCGDGPLRASVERAAAVAGSGALVLGDCEDPGRLIAASDVLLSTSQGSGGAGVLVEAGLAGVPCVAFDAGEAARVVRDGETGVLAPPGFVEVMAVVLADLLRNPDRGERMGAAAREACAPLRLESVAGRYAEAFARAMGAGGAGGAGGFPR